MMVVIADTSPIVVLINIGHVEILPLMYGEVVVPPEVWDELRDPKRPEAVRVFLERQPGWLVVKPTTRVEAFPGLHRGETAAINLALEIRANFVLMDDKDGYSVATKRGLTVVRTAALLARAAERGVLSDLKAAFERLKETDFRVSPALLDTLLARFEQQKLRRPPGE